MNKELFLTEDKKSQLIQKSRHADSYAPNNQHKGRNRYERRLHSRIANSVKEFNKINMNKLFTDDILDVKILVHGETDDYTVKISFSSVIYLLREQLYKSHPDGTDDDITVTDVMRTLTKAFDSLDVYIHCSCPDFKYRFGYWALINDISSFTDHATKQNGDVEDWRVSGMQPVVTNPVDSKGAGCKHCMLVLQNNSWLIKVASCLRNYIKYMKKHKENLYAEYMYPKLYGKEYEEPYQNDMIYKDLDDTDDEETIDTANKWAKTRGQWQKGNQYRFQKKDDDQGIKGQQELDLDSLADEEDGEDIEDEP